MFGFNNNYNAEITPLVMNFDSLQKARQDLIGEIEAVIQYDAHQYSTNDKTAREVWKSIKNEELVHVGELLALINYLDPDQIQYVKKGFLEFNDLQK